MKNTTLYRLSGLCLIASFLFALPGGMLHPIVDGHAHSWQALSSSLAPVSGTLIYVGALLLLLGLPGVYAWFAPRLGRLGLVGFVGYFLGNATIALGHLVVEAFVAPVLAADPRYRGLIAADGMLFESTAFKTFQTVFGLVMLLGLLLLGIAVLRSRVAPRWVGWLLVLGAASGVVPLPETPVLTGLLFEGLRGAGMAALAWIVVVAVRRGTEVRAETAVTV